jgi:hypothetical protein
MLVPSPRIVDDFIRQIPEGFSMDVKSLRQNWRPNTMPK